jgi:hypothetical protein
MGDIPEPEAAVAIPEPEPPSCLTLRCFYLRLSRCEVDESMLDTLTITYIPLSPDTVLEASGGEQQEQPPSTTDVDKRSVSFPLRRDRVDAASEEATFVSTTTVRIMAGSVRFEVQNGDERLLVGILETCDVDSLLLLGDAGDVTGKGGKSRMRRRSWVMKCQVATQRGSGFLRCGRAAKAPPAVEVYVVGVFRGTPIVFTKAMQLRFRRRRPVKAFMDPIPECAEQAEDAKETAQEHDPEVLLYLSSDHFNSVRLAFDSGRKKFLSVATQLTPEILCASGIGVQVLQARPGGGRRRQPLHGVRSGRA